MLESIIISARRAFHVNNLLVISARSAIVVSIKELAGKASLRFTSSSVSGGHGVGWAILAVTGAYNDLVAETGISPAFTISLKSSIGAASYRLTCATGRRSLYDQLSTDWAHQRRSTRIFIGLDNWDQYWLTSLAIRRDDSTRLAWALEAGGRRLAAVTVI